MGNDMSRHIKEVRREGTDTAYLNSVVYKAKRWAKFCGALQNNRSLTALHVVGHHHRPEMKLDRQAVGLLCSALSDNDRIRTLALPWNDLGNEGMMLLASCTNLNADNWSYPIYLDFSHNFIRAEGATALSEALRSNRLITDLNLQGNTIGDAGAEMVASALKLNKSLITLNLQANRIGDAGVHEIFDAFEMNSTLRTLDLWGNRVTHIGALDIGDTLRRLHPFRLAHIRLDQWWLPVAEVSGQSWTETEDKDEGGIVTITRTRVKKRVLKYSNKRIGMLDAVIIGKLLPMNDTCLSLDLSKNNMLGAGLSKRNKILRAQPLKFNRDPYFKGLLPPPPPEDEGKRSAKVAPEEPGKGGPGTKTKKKTEEKTAGEGKAADVDVDADEGEGETKEDDATTDGEDGDGEDGDGEDGDDGEWEWEYYYEDEDGEDGESKTDGEDLEGEEKKGDDKTEADSKDEKEEKSDDGKAGDDTSAEGKTAGADLAPGKEATAAGAETATVTSSEVPEGSKKGKRRRRRRRRRRKKELEYVVKWKVDETAAKVAAVNAVANELWGEDKVPVSQLGVYFLIHALRENNTLRRLVIAERGCKPIAGQWVVSALQTNTSLVELKLQRTALPITHIMRSLSCPDIYKKEAKRVENFALKIKPRKITVTEKRVVADLLRDNETLTSLNGVAFDDSTRLDLNGTVLQYFETVFIANRARGHKKLAHLNLSSCGLDIEAIKELCSGLKYAASLRHIDMRNNLLGDEGAALLVESLSLWAINHLDLSWNKIGPFGAVAVATHIQKLHSLKSVSMAGNPIEADGMVHILEACRTRRDLVELNLSWTRARVTAEIVPVLVQFLTARKLKRFKKFLLAAVWLDDAAVVRMAGAIELYKKSPLEVLDIAADGNIDPVGAHAQGQPLGKDGCIALAQLLRHNSKLRDLSLGEHRITMFGAQALGQALAINKTLRKLDLGHTADDLTNDKQFRRKQLGLIGAEGMKAFWRAFTEDPSVEFHLKELNVMRNQIGDKGCKATWEAMKANDHIRQSLTLLNVEGNDIGFEQIKKLKLWLENGVKDPKILAVTGNNLTDDENFKIGRQKKRHGVRVITDYVTQVAFAEKDELTGEVRLKMIAVGAFSLAAKKKSKSIVTPDESKKSGSPKKSMKLATKKIMGALAPPPMVKSKRNDFLKADKIDKMFNKNKGYKGR